jgi:hypothetical protein
VGFLQNVHAVCLRPYCSVSGGKCSLVCRGTEQRSALNIPTFLCRRPHKPSNILYHRLASTHESKNKYREERRTTIVSNDGQTDRQDLLQEVSWPSLYKVWQYVTWWHATARNLEASHNHYVRFHVLSTAKPMGFGLTENHYVTCWIIKFTFLERLITIVDSLHCEQDGRCPLHVTHTPPCYCSLQVTGCHYAHIFFNYFRFLPTSHILKESK